MTKPQIKVYISSVSSNMKIKKQQQRIEQILGGKKDLVDVTYVDIAACEDDKIKMRELMDDETALPPQLFNDDKHIGNYEAFDEAVECETLDTFLGVS